MAQTVKSPAKHETGFNLRVGKISWRREWQPTPVFLPGKSHGQRNLVGYSPCGCKELDMTKRLILSLQPLVICTTLIIEETGYRYMGTSCIVLIIFL